MIPGSPWNFRGARRKAREAAPQATRASSASLGDWLNNIVATELADHDRAPAADPDPERTGNEKPALPRDFLPPGRTAFRSGERPWRRPRESERETPPEVKKDAGAPRPSGSPYREDRRNPPEGRKRSRDERRHNRNDQPIQFPDRDYERNLARAREEFRSTAREAARREAAHAREEIRAAAREAARREAAQAREQIRATAREEARREAASAREQLGELNSRLETLSAELDRLSKAQSRRTQPVTRPDPPPPKEPAPQRQESLTGAPPRRQPKLHIPQPERDTLTIDEAIAEITERQRILDGGPGGGPRNRPDRRSNKPDAPTAPAVDLPPRSVLEDPPALQPQSPPEPTTWEEEEEERPARVEPSRQAPTAPDAPAEKTAAATPPAVDFSNLEQQLRQITAQIESLQSNGLGKAIASLRNDLADISRQLTEALPRRAVESLEIEVKALAERIDHSRQSGIDAEILGNLERALAEIYGALRGLTTAENLVGFDDAVKALAQKVDLILSRDDPAVLQQLEAAIGGLRSVVSHVASSEALTKVAEDVRALSAQIDGLASNALSGQAVSALEQRIDSLAAALTASNEAGHAVPHELEKLLAGLIEKLEWVQLTHTDHAALAHLEDRIAALVKRFDASDARWSHLEGIERGLADLLVHLEHVRGGGAAAGESRVIAPVDESLQREIAQIRQSEQRTLESIEVIQGTVEHVVDRLATIESSLHRDAANRNSVVTEPEPPGPAPAEPTGSGQQNHTADTADKGPEVFGPSLSPAAPPPSSTRSASTRTPIDPTLPPDHPLEPGSAAGRSPPGASAADRIAASEAAVASARPPVISDSERPNFIEAARRAARAAAWDPNEQQANKTIEEKDGAAQPNKLSERLRKLLVAGGVVLIVLGCARIATRLLDTGGFAIGWHGPSAHVRSSSIPAPADVAAKPTPAGKPLALLNPALNPPPQAEPAETKAIPGPSATLSEAEVQPNVVTVPSSDHEPTVVPTQPQSAPLITGSLPGSAANTSQSPSPPPAAAAAKDELPASIGNRALRAAALAGNSAAAYEIASRYAEGRTVPRDSEAAARWFERAASQGLAMAQFRLGGLYEKGIGVKKSLAKAHDLYFAAAEKGNGKAMHNLAVLYAEGIDGPPDYRSAAKWFLKAADHGIKDSQYNLGILYARGIGVEQSYAESYKWFALAASQGDQEAAKKRDEIAAHLDARALAAARLAVKNWSAEAQPADAISVRTDPAWSAPAQHARPASNRHAPARAVAAPRNIKSD